MTILSYATALGDRVEETHPTEHRALVRMSELLRSGGGALFQLDSVPFSPADLDARLPLVEARRLAVAAKLHELRRGVAVSAFPQLSEEVRSAELSRADVVILAYETARVEPKRRSPRRKPTR